VFLKKPSDALRLFLTFSDKIADEVTTR